MKYKFTYKIDNIPEYLNQKVIILIISLCNNQTAWIDNGLKSYFQEYKTVETLFIMSSPTISWHLWTIHQSRTSTFCGSMCRRFFCDITQIFAKLAITPWFDSLPTYNIYRLVNQTRFNNWNHLKTAFLTACSYQILSFEILGLVDVIGCNELAV